MVLRVSLRRPGFASGQPEEAGEAAGPAGSESRSLPGRSPPEQGGKARAGACARGLPSPSLKAGPCAAPRRQRLV